MEVRVPAIEIVPDDPFANCKLKREIVAKRLTSFIQVADDGFVLALDNKWGTGKSTFVQMWGQQLSNLGYKTIYFNAWENDFHDDPFVSILGELKPILKPKDHKSLITTASSIFSEVAPEVAKGLVKKISGSDTIVDSVVAATKGAAAIFKKEVDDHLKKKKGLISFKNQLNAFVQNKCGNKQLIIIIDELDRCRPDYAVGLLEKVKHMFSVNNIIFVLAIDKTQLSYAIQGYYGSNNIDASEYLRRFINVEFSLPEPDPQLYYDFLLPRFFVADKIEKDYYDQLRQIRVLPILRHLTLRQLESIFFIFGNYFKNYSRFSFMEAEIVFFLTTVKIIAPLEYSNFYNSKYTIIEFHDVIFSFFILDKGDVMDAYSAQICTNLEVALLFLYTKTKYGINDAHKAWGKSISNPNIPQKSKISSGSVYFDQGVQHLLRYSNDITLSKAIEGIDSYNNFNYYA